MNRVRRFATDGLAVLLLIMLWWFFFWRLFTTNPADQASIEKGDFSGQFLAFAAYQADRFAQGEIPLWNPYNNGGLPFVGDTQAAVFYPPRLLTIALSRLAGSWTYHSLELEMIFHVLAGSLFMYLMLRRWLTGGLNGIVGALIGALVFAYGGFMQSYPPLQLAILEAAIWLPLAVLGIHEATRSDLLRWRWLILTALTYGLSWLAGHPQTTFFSTYLLAALLLYRGWRAHIRWPSIGSGVLFFGILGGGLAAVQLLPGVEYLAQTTRTGMGFDAKGNGFPFQDVIQFIIPNLVSQWSPLYVGLVGLVLALLALARRLKDSPFWGGAALLALLLSFGANSPFFALIYNTLPGLSFFRGQERAAFVVAFALAMLAAAGAAAIAPSAVAQPKKTVRRGLIGVFLACSGVSAVLLALRFAAPTVYDAPLRVAAFAALVSAAATILLPWWLAEPRRTLPNAAVVMLLIFELFTVSMGHPANYDAVPPDQQITLEAPPLVALGYPDDGQPFRVDGYRAVHDNYASLYRVYDMRGISPLFLRGPYSIIGSELINPTAWELFAVRIVYSDWTALPIPSQVVAEGQDRYGPVQAHVLKNPRPFAHLVYQTESASSQEEALALLRAAGQNWRQVAIVEGDVITAPGSGDARVTTFTPERIVVEVETDQPALLTLAHPAYVGWRARLNDAETPILRTYGALSGIAVPPGRHTLELWFDPTSVRLGAVISLLSLLLCALLLLPITRPSNVSKAR